MSSFERVKRFLADLKQEQITFKQHCLDRMQERPITEVMIRMSLQQTSRLFQVEEQPSRHQGEKKIQALDTAEPEVQSGADCHHSQGRFKYYNGLEY